MTSQVLPILPISSFVYKLLLGAVHKGYPTLPLVSRFAKMGYEDIYRAIGNYCDAGSTLFGAEVSISNSSGTEEADSLPLASFCLNVTE